MRNQQRDKCSYVQDSFLFFASQSEATAPRLTETLGYGGKPGLANAIPGNLDSHRSKMLGIDCMINAITYGLRLVLSGSVRITGILWSILFLHYISWLHLFNDVQLRLY